MFTDCFDCPFLSRYFKKGDYLFYECSGGVFKKAKIHKDNLHLAVNENCPYLYKGKATD